MDFARAARVAPAVKEERAAAVAVSVGENGLVGGCCGGAGGGGIVADAEGRRAGDGWREFGCAGGGGEYPCGGKSGERECADGSAADDGGE